MVGAVGKGGGVGARAVGHVAGRRRADGRVGAGPAYQRTLGRGEETAAAAAAAASAVEAARRASAALVRRSSAAEDPSGVVVRHWL